MQSYEIWRHFFKIFIYKQRATLLEIFFQQKITFSFMDVIFNNDK